MTRRARSWWLGVAVVVTTGCATWGPDGPRVVERTAPLTPAPEAAPRAGPWYDDRGALLRLPLQQARRELSRVMALRAHALVEATGESPKVLRYRDFRLTPYTDLGGFTTAPQKWNTGFAVTIPWATQVFVRLAEEPGGTRVWVYGEHLVGDDVVCVPEMPPRPDWLPASPPCRWYPGPNVKPSVVLRDTLQGLLTELREDGLVAPAP